MGYVPRERLIARKRLSICLLGVPKNESRRKRPPIRIFLTLERIPGFMLTSWAIR